VSAVASAGNPRAELQRPDSGQFIAVLGQRGLPPETRAFHASGASNSRPRAFGSSGLEPNDAVNNMMSQSRPESASSHVELGQVDYAQARVRAEHAQMVAKPSAVPDVVVDDQ